MGDSGIWSVDRIAASNLLANLGLEASDERVELVAGHFASNRHSSYEWAAERAHSSVLNMLSSTCTDLFQRKPEAWNEGFRAAEHAVIAMARTALLDIPTRGPRTKGQVLRAMIRQAHRQDGSR